MPLLFLHPSKPPTLFSKSTQTLVQSPKHPSFRQTHISFSSNNESFYSLSTTHLPFHLEHGSIQGIRKLGLLLNSSNLPFSRKAHVSFCSKNVSFEGLAATHLSNRLEHGKIQGIQKLGLLVISSKTPCSREAHVSFCSKNESFEGLVTTQLPIQQEDGPIGDIEELGLLGKPTPKPIATGDIEVEVKPPKPDEEEALKPFLKFFTPRDSLGELSDVGESSSSENEKGESKKVIIEYYDPKPGDFVIGVVVSGNENRLDVNVGADYLGTMLTKEVLPLYGREMDYLLCDTEKDADEFLVYGKMGIVKDEVAVSADLVAGRPVVEVGTVLFAEVLGRTLSGRPLLSTRRFFRRIAWHRVRQIKQLNEPIEVTITEWNTGGLLTRIEGLRAFLPKNELMGKVNSFTDLKDNVGRKINVKITRIDEANNDLILSEKSAWEMLNLREGALLEGTVRKIYPFGAQIRIGETNRSGLLHISNLSKGKIESVSDVLAVDEKVKVLVVKSLFPGKISLSTADLESEPGLFVSNKEKVFSEAEAMARKYRQKLPTVSAKQKLEPLGTDGLSFCNEPSLYSNWKWFQFEEASE